MKMEASDSYKTLVYIYQTIWRHVPECCDLNIHQCENLKFHIVLCSHTYWEIMKFCCDEDEGHCLEATWTSQYTNSIKSSVHWPLFTMFIFMLLHKITCRIHLGKIKWLQTTIIFKILLKYQQTYGTSDFTSLMARLLLYIANHIEMQSQMSNWEACWLEERGSTLEC